MPQLRSAAAAPIKPWLSWRDPPSQANAPHDEAKPAYWRLGLLPAAVQHKGMDCMSVSSRASAVDVCGDSKQATWSAGSSKLCPGRQGRRHATARALPALSQARRSAAGPQRWTSAEAGYGRGKQADELRTFHLTGGAHAAEPIKAASPAPQPLLASCSSTCLSAAALWALEAPRGAPIPPIMREAPEPVPVWHEYAEAGADGGEQGQQQQQQAATQPPLGSAAARQWLAAIARHCEGTEGAQAKAALNELLRCGSRARDKVVTVTNRARQAISTVFRCGALRRRRALAAPPPAWLGLGTLGVPPRLPLRLKSHGHRAAADMCMRPLRPPAVMTTPCRRTCNPPHTAGSSPPGPCSWTHHAEDPPGTDNPARARECLYLFER